MVIKIKNLLLSLVLLAGVLNILAPQSVSAATITCIDEDGQTVTRNVREDQSCGDLGLSPDTSPNAPDSPAGTTGEDGACGVDTTILQCSGSGDNPIIRAFMEVFNFFAVGIGILVVIGIIIGGIKYVTANGNTSQAEQGITTIVNAVIGLLLFIFMFALLNWLVPGGLFR